MSRDTQSSTEKQEDGPVAVAGGSVLSRRVLVLNKSWRPIRTATVRDALTLVYQGGAQIVDPTSYVTYDFQTWREAASFARESHEMLKGAVLQGYGWTMPAPEVVVLRHYNGWRQPGHGVSRRQIFARDRHQCQYCGTRRKSEDLTLDHVLPRSRGGKATWENLVVACLACNQRKGNRTPKEAHLSLRRTPRRPGPTELLLGELRTKPLGSWEGFLSDMYWSTELEE